MRSRQSWSALMRYRDDCPHELAELLWHQPDRLLEMGKPLTRSFRSRAKVVVRIQDREYVVKRWKEHSWYHAVKRPVLRSRAARCWHDTLFLLDNQVATPSPVAYREKRFGPFRGISHYVYEFVPGRTLARAARLKTLSAEVEFDLANQVVKMWRQMGEAGVSLADPSMGNFVIDPSGHLWVIDLDKLRRHRLSYTRTRGFRRSLDRFLSYAPFRPEVTAWIYKALS